LANYTQSALVIVELRRFARLVFPTVFSTWAFVVAIALRDSSTLFLNCLGEGWVWRLQLFQCARLGWLGLATLHPQPRGGLTVEGFRFRVDDGVVLLTSDSNKVRYPPVRALAFNDAARCGPSSWYTSNLWRQCSSRSPKMAPNDLQ